MSNPHDSKSGVVHATKSAVPPLPRAYLTKQQNIPEDLYGGLIEQGMQFPEYIKAAKLLGFAPDPKWTAYIWLPRREPDGGIINGQGTMVLLRMKQSEVEPEALVLERGRLSPPRRKDTPTTHLSFFGNESWTDYDGEFDVHESWLKAALAHLLTGRMTIGLQGVDTYKYIDDLGFRRLVPHLDYQLWAPKAIAHICFDSPALDNPKSAEGLAKSKTNLAYLLAKKCASVYDISIPPPDSGHLSWDFNDWVGAKGDEAFTLLYKRRRLMLRGQINQQAVLRGTDIWDLEPPEDIVVGLLHRGEQAILFGPTGCGKSFTALDLLIRISRGAEEFMAHPIRISGPVVHITLEGTGLRNRLHAYGEYHGLTREQVCANYYPIVQQVNLADEATADSLIASIQAVIPAPPVIIAIDTVSRAIGGAKEDEETFGRLVVTATEIQQAFPGCTILHIHHTGKDESRKERGSTVLPAACGIRLEMNDPDKNGVRTMKVLKLREGGDGGKISIRLTQVDLGRNKYGDPLNSCVAVLSSTPQTDAEQMHFNKILFWMEREGKESITKTDVKRGHNDINAAWEGEDAASSRRELAEAFDKECTDGGRLGSKDGTRWTLTKH